MLYLSERLQGLRVLFLWRTNLRQNFFFGRLEKLKACHFFCYSYYGTPGTSLFYPVNPAAGIPLTAAAPFGTPANGLAATGGAQGLHAHNLQASLAVAAAAAAQQQQHQHQQNVLGSQFQFQTAAHAAQATGPVSAASGLALKSSAPLTSHINTAASSTVVGSSLVTGGSAVGSSSVTTSSSSKLGSPAAKKFRPAFARPHKGSRYIPKPIPQELGNLKTYSKPIFIL